MKALFIIVLTFLSAMSWEAVFKEKKQENN